MSKELKIKSKTLAAEAKFIKLEERKAKELYLYRRNKQLDTTRVEKARAGFVDHRKHIVRPEARATFLARAFIRGDKYRDVESPRYPEIPLSCMARNQKWGYVEKLLDRVVVMVNKYGNQKIVVKDVEDWIKDG